MNITTSVQPSSGVTCQENRPYLLLTLALLFSPFCSAAPSDTQIDEVVVTGSLLPADKKSLTSVVSWDSDTIKRADNFRLANFLETLPQVGRPANTLTTAGFSTLNGGLSSVDLRGLGASRSLVLIDGKRLNGGDPSSPAVVDLNSIPAQMIERVEVYTGGATAVYGSGAMAGVINIITKKNLQGTFINVKKGLSAQNDGAESAAALTLGKSFADQKGQLTLGLNWDKSDVIWSSDRDFSKNNERLGDRAAFSSFTERGTITSAVGVRVPNNQGLWLDTYNIAQHGYNQNKDRQLAIPLERKQGNLFASFQFHPDHNAYVQLGGSSNNSSNQQEPSSLILNGRPEPLPSGYPFFPKEILDTWTSTGKAVPASINYNRRLSELGPRTYQQQRDSWRLLTGIESNFGLWHSDLSVQTSRSEFSQLSLGHYNTANLSNSLKIEADLDNPGQYRCISAAARDAGCKPANVFGEQGLAADTLAYIQASQSTGAQLQQHEVQWQINGPLLTLPAGELNTLLGANWRQEEIESTIDALTQSGLSSSVALSPVNGRDELSEIFAETRIPLVNETIVKKMDASFAYRLSDYDSAGAATGWSSALSLSPWANLDLFARRSAAVRAPSISELYLPPRGGTLNIADPCAANASVSASTREKCRSLGIPDSFAPSPQELAVPYRIRGNDQLQEETGYTTSFGLTYRPLEDNALTLRAEYFDIDIHNAIVNIDPTFKLNSCYSAEDFPTSWFCRGLNRGTSAQNFRFTQIDAGLENIGRFQTRGSDFEIASQIPLWGGSLHNRLLATYTNLWQQTANNKTLNRLGEPGLQQWKGSYSLGFDKGAWDSTVSVRHLKSGTIENDSTQAYIRANNHVPSVSYFDAYLGYRFTQAQANGKSRRVYLSAHNLTDQDPPYVPGESLRNGNPGTSTSASVYDVRGRYWRVGMEYEF